MAGGGVDESDGGVCECGGREQGRAGGSGKRFDALLDELMERVRDGEGCAGRRFPLVERAPDLECVEGVAARGLVDAQQQRSRQRPVEPVVQKPVQGAEG